MKVEVECCVCNKKELVYESRAKKYSTCSLKCMGLSFRKEPEFKCYTCGKLIHVQLKRIKRLINEEHITCSMECAKKVKSDLYTGRNNPNTKHKMLDDNFFKEVKSEQKAYLLGWIASDGHISKTGEIIIQVHEKDEQCMIDLSKVVSDELTIVHYPKKKQVAFRMCSKTMVNDVCELLKIKPGKKSDVVQFPELENDFLKWAFLRGYFDGDGCVSSISDTHNSPRSSIVSNSINMLKYIETFCKIPCNLNEKNNSIEWSGNNCLDFLHKLYFNSSMRLIRKYNLYEDISTWVPSVSYSKYFKNECFKYSKTRLDAIAPSKTRASDSGYDLTVLEKVKSFGEVGLYDTGIKVTPNFGLYFDLVPRSSIIKTGYMLANSVGIIDRTYLGNIMVPLIKIDKNAPDLELPNKIVQLIPRPIIHVEFEELPEEELGATSRGSGGFGSTGKN